MIGFVLSYSVWLSDPRSLQILMIPDDPISNDPILMISATFLLKIASFSISKIARFFKKVFTGFHEYSGLLKVGFLNFSNSADTHWIIYLLTVMFCTDLYANCRTYILYLPHLKTQCRHLTHFAWVMRSRFSDYNSSFYLRDTLLSKWHSRMSLKVWNFRRNIPNIILKWYEKGVKFAIGQSLQPIWDLVSESSVKNSIFSYNITFIIFTKLRSRGLIIFQAVAKCVFLLTN